MRNTTIIRIAAIAAVALGAAEIVRVEGIVLDLTLQRDDVVDLVEEEHVDARDVADAVVVHAEPHLPVMLQMRL